MLLVSTPDGNFLVSWEFDFSGKRPATTCTIGNVDGTAPVSKTVKQYHKDKPSTLAARKFSMQKVLDEMFPEQPLEQVEKVGPTRTKNNKNVRKEFWNSFTETVL